MSLYLVIFYFKQKNCNFDDICTINMNMKTVLQEPKTLRQIENILITQAKPEGDKSPYFEMAKKYNVSLNFQPFIRVEPISAKEFRKPVSYTHLTLPTKR